jgi:hypothetical protein
MSDAAFNLLQLEQRPSWYDHVDAAEAAMRQAETDWLVRQDFGWDGDDGGEWGPESAPAGEDLLATDREDALALPFPEDFEVHDSYVYALMEVIGKYKDDPALMAHAVALRAADYLGSLGQPSIGTIRGKLRHSCVLCQYKES